MGAFNDMSKQLQRMLHKRQRLHLHQHLAEIGEIATAVVHRPPISLQVFGLAAHELSQTNTPRLADELAATARRSIARVDRVLSSYLSLAARDDVDTSQVDVRSVLSDVVLEGLQAYHHHGGRQSRGIRLCYTPTTAPLYLQAVPEEIRVIIHVVLTHAIEAAPMQSEVEVSAGAVQKDCIVQVADHGAGIAAIDFPCEHDKAEAPAA